MTTFKVGQTVSVPTTHEIVPHAIDPTKRLYAWIESIEANGEVMLGGVSAYGHLKTLSAEEAARLIRVETECPQAFSFCMLTGLVTIRNGLLSVGWSPLADNPHEAVSHPLFGENDCVVTRKAGDEPERLVSAKNVRQAYFAAEACQMPTAKQAREYREKREEKERVRRAQLEEARVSAKRKRDLDSLGQMDDELIAEYLASRRKDKK